jgi:hypothetical protein
MESVSRKLPEQPFDTWTRRLFVGVIVAGTVAALAWSIPSFMRSEMLLAALALWLTLAVTSPVIAARHTLRLQWSQFDLATTTLSVTAIGVAGLMASQLEIVRALHERPALTWNVDWRYALNHAQAIARSGGNEVALDYTGVALNYHVGPAWFAGAAERVLGQGMTTVLFGLVPLLSVLTIAIALIHILKGQGTPLRLAAVAVAVTLTAPALASSPFELLAGLPGRALQQRFWTFSPALMLNSFLGLAIGLSSLALLLDRRARRLHLAAGTVGLAALIHLKPQYFVGVGLVAGVVGFRRLLGSHRVALRHNAVLWAAVSGLALAVLLLVIEPHTLPIFAAPRWAPARTGYSLSELSKTSSILFVISMTAWLWSRNRVESIALCRELGVTVAVVMMLLVAALFLIKFPIRPELVDRVADRQKDLGQSLVPLRLLLVAGSLGLLAVLMARAGPLWKALLVVAGGVTVVSPSMAIATSFLYPMRGYEAAEDRDLFEILRETPTEGVVLIASDLADPAQDFARPLRAPLLTAYGGHQFYLSNVEYVHSARPDAFGRLDELRAFFGSSWSDWHAAWLAQNLVTHVLVSDRCVPVWLQQAALPLRHYSHRGRWSVYVSEGPRGRELPSVPTFQALVPRYGRARCL